MYCECECDVDWDAEPYRCYKAKLVTARKTHHCCECGELIAPGDCYERAGGYCDGRWDRFATCALCMRIRDDICSCAPHGTMREEIFEQLGFDYVTHETARWAREEDERVAKS